MRTTADKPHYGKYVRELHWTALDSFQNMLCRERPLAAQPRYCDSVFYKATSWDWDGSRAMFTPTEKLDLMRKAFHDSCEDEKKPGITHIKDVWAWNVTAFHQKMVCCSINAEI
jgi:hypothetical protein